MSLNVNNNVGYTVVGNPTIVDGVASGFSDNDYLQIQNAATTLSNSSTFEIITKFKMSSMEGWKIINKMWTTPTNYQGGLSTQNGKVRWYIYNASVSVSMTCDTTLSKDVWYYAKQTKINNVYSVSWSNDGITWYDMKEVELADAGFYETFLYGSNQGSGNKQLSIDLNETYIKVNGVTWFSGKQQASSAVNEVYLNRNVGYTTNGSPTISDGTLSNLIQTQNYLTLSIPNNFSLENTEIVFRGRKNNGTQSTVYTAIPFLWGRNSKLWVVVLSGSISVRISSSVTKTFNLPENLDNTAFYTYKIICKTSSIQVLMKSEADLDFTSIGTEQISSPYDEVDWKVIGGNQWYWTTGTTFACEIDLNKTYIKKDGITIFSGKQQASSAVNEVYLNRNVGYDIIGSPTIVDGVASGFSANDNLKLSQQANNSIPFEMVVCFTANSVTPQSSDGFGICMVGDAQMFITSGSKLMVKYNTGSNQWISDPTILSANTKYWGKFAYDGTNVGISISTDGVQFTTPTTQANNPRNRVVLPQFGYVSNSYQPFEGSIDLNNTYIKVNGVTWFNGKQTATTPVWTRSV